MWCPFLALISEHHVANDLMPEATGLATRLYSDPRFWLGAVLCAPILSLMLDFCIEMVQQQLQPGDHHILQVLLVAFLGMQAHNAWVPSQTWPGRWRLCKIAVIDPIGHAWVA